MTLLGVTLMLMGPEPSSSASPALQWRANGIRTLTHTVGGTLSAPASASLNRQPASVPSGAMVPVPSGPFTMGSDTGEIDERPAHEVSLSAYFIDRTEVTAAEFAACTAPGCTTSHASSSCNAGVAGREQYPVNCVTWFQAAAYCEWAGKRLPTEAEWEKAARGTDRREFPWGSDAPSCRHAAFLGCPARMVPVGTTSLGYSPYGAADMAGNVLEWVNDWYDGRYYRASAPEDPRGPASGSTRALRGGSISLDPSDLRAAGRLFAAPPSDWADDVGFRCARSG